MVKDWMQNNWKSIQCWEKKKNYKRPAESLTPSNQNLKKWRVAQDFYMLLYVAIVYF